MEITSATYGKDPAGTGENTCVLATINGVKWAVPLDPTNVQYEAILQWVADGNTITPAE